jgi:hypothetical protein
MVIRSASSAELMIPYECEFTHPCETQLLEVGGRSSIFILRKCVRVHRANADWIRFKRHLVVGCWVRRAAISHCDE